MNRLKLCMNNPESYLGETLNNPGLLMTYLENVRITLDSADNAQKARLLISSMIQNKYYLQKTKYIFPEESVEKEQKVDTTELIPQLKLMLEIIKQWETFDVNQFSQSLANNN